jgi:cytosine/adenosine deaminase-related metal-dependent hydrolase
METVAKPISREWLDWPFFEPRHRAVCEALDRFVMSGGLDAVNHSDVDGACRKLARALGAARLRTTGAICFMGQDRVGEEGPRRSSRGAFQPRKAQRPWPIVGRARRGLYQK